MIQAINLRNDKNNSINPKKVEGIDKDKKNNKFKSCFFGAGGIKLTKLTNFGKTEQYKKRRGIKKHCLKCRGRDITDTEGIKR